MLRKSKLRDHRGAETASACLDVLKLNPCMGRIISYIWYETRCWTKNNSAKLLPWIISLAVSLTHACALAEINISQMRSPNCASDATVSNIPADCCSASLQDSPACTRNPTDYRKRCKYSSVSGCSCRETQMCIYHIRGAPLTAQCYDK